LGSSLLFAVFTVVIFISVFLGWRPAIIVGLAVPISYGITLMFDMAFGYTINRVTLFALILSLGLLVDDPITGIDNIERFLKKKHGTTKEKIAAAISELKIPLVMSTITIILAFIPLAFITGMMGPYMAPMAFNVPISVAASTVVAFIVTPWLASKILKPEPANATNDKEGRFKRFYTHFLDTILSNRRYAKFTLFIVLILFIGTALLPMFRLVPLKLLPFDNKNEIQVIIDMPESSTLEQTASKAKQVSNIIKEFNEVLSVASFVAEPSPIDFNGMVRRYYQRNTPYFADLRIILVDKDLRQHQSHGIVLRLRKKLAALNTDLVKIKVVEVPPGPPVLSTLVAEVYGNSITPYSRLQDAASLVEARLAKEAHIVEIDSTVEDDQYRYRFIVDKTKAALSGVSTQEVNDLIALANHGYTAGFLQLESEAKPLPIELRLPYAEISSLNDILRLQIRGQHGIAKTASSLGVDSSPQPLVALGEIGTFEKSLADKSFQRKDLKPVVYVTAELSGRTPAEVIADIHADLNNENIKATHWQDRNYFSMGGGDSWTLPDDISVKWTGEGEWEITVKVFRDMGLAFMFALVGIFFVLKLQTKSTALSLIIMSAIPLTIIGIMPGFWLLNQFGEREIAQAPEPVLFTATAMIGMIALAGIVVRNSLILVEFITQSLEQGLPLKHALIEAGSVRMRPVLLTAGTTLLGNLIITLDPVFSGLAIAIIFGIISSTIFTLLVIPIVYLLVFDKPSKA
ncbi:MAG: efflux RND transporter permease subunit, partial [Sinobacterium sp.]|nr:efflux RND transporter permease subunit [Sinobacterium sp.]